ncbi:NAD-dependent epimerase [Desulfovibrio sp. OttesenSCG-928-G15]|nr:NAD-dependent epimerase [Desulfovibrio sp. OttesenSCG-928-G15]
MRILVTGAAGFIGYHLCAWYLESGVEVCGIDNLNDYYDPQLKLDRLAGLRSHDSFLFHKIDIADAEKLDAVFADFRPSHVVNLAAQAGVRYSLINPGAYVQSNLVGFGNLLECCRKYAICHLVYASSSSVYGLNTQMPFSTEQCVDHPVSLYAATKKSNEMMAHSYSHLFGIPTTGLRFFTVYGPWGRPDMAACIFTKAILAGEPIPVFNNGHLQRDFTYIDDIVKGVTGVVPVLATPSDSWNSANPSVATSSAPYRLYNIGNNNPVELLSFIATLEDALGRKAKLHLLPMQPGDVQATYADIQPLSALVGFQPSTDLATGIKNFVSWYEAYYSG